MTDPLAAPNINTLWADILVDEFIRCGLRHACICPGSRSTPLTLALGKRPEIDDRSIIDERSAAFVALGLAKATARPVLVVCTSGTAAANFFPAICEARAAGQPLIVLTADRPRELQGVGASQAMDQLKLYGDQVCAFYEVGQPEAKAKKLRYLRGLVDRAVARSQAAQPGPVHLNFAFRKPLAPVEDRRSLPQSEGVDKPLVETPAVVGRRNGRPWLEISLAHQMASPGVLDRLEKRISAAQRPLIFAGADAAADSEQARAILNFARESQIPVYAEATSGLRVAQPIPEGPDPVVNCADKLIGSDFYEQQGRPDLVIRLGRAPILWATRQWIPALKDSDHILIGSGEEPADPDQIAGWQIRVEPGPLFSQLADISSSTATAKTRQAWFGAHRQAQEIVENHRRTELRSAEKLSAPVIWYKIGAHLPPSASLFVSSSMPLRDIETFMGRTVDEAKIYANRGINGIDGIISTGTGIALGRPATPTLIVCGDVALRHDMGAIWMAQQQGIDATIVVIDNGGGAIFEELPLGKLSRQANKRGGEATALPQIFDRHFRTPTALSKNLAFPAGLDVVAPSTPDELGHTLASSLQRPGLQLILATTDADGDRQTRRALQQSAVEVISS